MSRYFWILCAFLAVLTAGSAQANDDYNLGPDSLPQPGVPRGEVTHYSITSRIFPGTQREFTVYVPRQYDAAKPACVMFFQDGGGVLNVNTVFDNLIFKKEMPVTVAIMIPPGVVPAAGPDALPRFNRSHEYDGMSGDYARFLIEEILPEVGKKLNLSKDPNDRGLCGGSSGGIAAFTAAWQRPDQFRRVISFIGSYTDLQGGNVYNSLIRKFEPKPLRVFLQDGSNDQDIYSGNWPNGNKEVYDALRYAGYDVKFVLGDGPHSGRHGASILPDVLRWIWRDYPRPIAQPSQARWPLNEAWIPGEDWTAVAGVSGRAAGMASDSDGAVWVSLPHENRVVCIGADGSVDTSRTLSLPGVTGIAMGPAHTLYASQPAAKRIVRIGLAATGAREQPAVRDVVTSHLVVNHNGEIYYTDDRNGHIYYVSAAGRKREVSGEVPRASVLILSPDQTLLTVTQSEPSKWGYSFQIGQDGGLSYCQAFYDLHVPYGALSSGAAAMAQDKNGWLYVAASDGIQFLDQAGRVNGILNSPAAGGAELLAFGGADRSWLYASQDGSLFRRKLKSQGALACEPPIKPPAPRL